jgi:hypothetical protein
MKILRLLLWLLVSMATINYTPTTASQFSNVGQYPVTLEIPNYTVVSTNGILT